jgi:hypothetical protein
MKKEKNRYYVRIIILQRRIVKKIHCYCLEGGIYNLKKSIFYSTSTLIPHGMNHG